MRPNTQDSVMAGQLGIDLNTFKDDTTPTAFDPCRWIWVIDDIDVKLYWTGAPTTAMTRSLKANTFYDLSFVKITTTADGVVAADKIIVGY